MAIVMEIIYTLLMDFILFGVMQLVQLFLQDSLEQFLLQDQVVLVVMVDKLHQQNYLLRWEYFYPQLELYTLLIK